DVKRPGPDSRTNKPRVWLDGMSYQSIRTKKDVDDNPKKDVGDNPKKDVKAKKDVDEHDGSLHELLDLLGGAEFSADAYTNLEAFYRRQGNASAANQVFVAMKHQERQKLW